MSYYAENKWLIQKAFQKIRESPNGQRYGLLHLTVVAIMLSPTIPAEAACRIINGLTKIAFNKKGGA